MLVDGAVVEKIRTKFEALSPLLNERARRVWAATEVEALGRGGLVAVAEATGMARSTILKGQAELKGDQAVAGMPPERTRKQGGGRRLLTADDDTLLEDLERLVDPTTRGEPTSPLRWTCKSLRVLARELKEKGHQVSHTQVGTLLKQLGFSLQAARKTREGSSHPDRNAQFEHIHDRAQEMMDRGQPVISVDTKKKENVGQFQNGGREWQPTGYPEEVNSHDFPSLGSGKAIPYGVYDIFRNNGWVNVGIDHDTAEFAVESIRRWWKEMGSQSYGEANELMITADSGGSNGARTRLWKQSLQSLADETGLTIHVCHFPPGTSKWNKIEHRMFCHITRNWRGRPLTSLETVVNLIASTTTTKGLKIDAALDENSYPKGIRVTDAQMQGLNLVRDSFHGDWNYSILPSRNASID